jgi:hypothetical protein
MGGAAQQILKAIAPQLEEGTGTTLKGMAEDWFTTSGRSALKKLGPPGEFLANHLDHYEAYKAGASSRSKAAVEQIHTNPVKLQTFKNGMVQKLQQSGTVVNASVAHPHVYHPDLGKPNSAMRKQAITEIRTNTNMTAAQAQDTINKLLTDQNTRNAATNMLDPVYALQTGRLPDKESYQKWGDAVSSRVAQNVFFGPQDRNLAAIVHTVKETKGRVSAGRVADFLDIFLHNTMPAAYRVEGLKHQPAYKAANEAEKLINKISSYIFTSRIAIPHATQWVNTVLNSGLKASFEGAFSLINDRKAAVDFVTSSGALDEELRREIEIGIRGGDSIFKKIVHQPGFNWIRRQELIFSAVVGKHEALDAATQFLQSGSKDSATALAKLGINPNDLRVTGALTPEMERTAAYYAANRDMYFRSPLNTPFRWSGTPAARIRTQYKPFAFNMQRMIVDTLKRDWERGATVPAKIFNVSKSLAVLGTLFPVAGELISLAENQALGRQDNPTETDTPFSPKWKSDHAFFDQYVNAMAHVSAFGIAYSMFRASARRMLSNFVLGPTESSVLDFAGDINKAIMGTTNREGVTTHDVRPLARDVVRKIPLVGPAAARQFIPSKKKEEGFSTRQSTKF